MVEADAGEFCEGDREEREVDPGDAEAEGEEADREAERHAQRDCDPQAGPRPDAPVVEHRARGVGGHADIDRMPERQLPGEAHHHVPRLPGIGEVEDKRGDRQRIGSGDGGKRDEEDYKNSQIGKFPFQGRFPSKPCGRKRSTRIRSPKLNMLLAEGTMNSPASASEAPISTPPSSAPAIEPRPPTITMTNASNV